MKHSIILKVGENLIYQCGKELKPQVLTPDGVKSFLDWQMDVKSYLIKLEDRAQFNEYIILDQIEKGVLIPYQIIELVEDKTVNKTYAKINKNVNFNKAENKIISVGFTCKICDAVDNVDGDKYDARFPVCRACISDLRDYVILKRLQ